MTENNSSRKLHTQRAKESRNVYHAPSAEYAAQKRNISETRRIRTADSVRTEDPIPSNRPKRKKKKKGCAGGCFKVFLVLILLLAVLFFAAFKLITGKVAGNSTISQVINTPSEYKGDVVNILVCGIDWEDSPDRVYIDGTNDGMTDMIMYVNFDVANKKINMLQIPRNTFVGDSVKASNGQINSVMVSNGGDINVLAELIHDQLKLPVDYYVTINMQSLREIVDTFGGLEVYVPHDIEYAGSILKQGYQTMDGAAAEFFVRNRKGNGYERADLDRLNMQRYFYSALLSRLKTMTMFDVAKLMPAFMNYVETDVPGTTMASLGVSVLQVESPNIMISQMPVFASGKYYNNNSVVVGAADQTADLLNEYFRTYTDPVDASQLKLQSWYPYGEASDPNVQFMGKLEDESRDAYENNNLDGSNTSFGS